MATNESILTVIEPTDGGDTALDLAHETVERGGEAKVVMVISDRVRRNIAEFARSENLSSADAEVYAIERLGEQVRSRIGANTSITTSYQTGDLAKLVTPETTTVAVPAHFISRRGARKLSQQIGVPVVVSGPEAA